MPEKNKCYEAEITDVTADGNGVCRIDGMAVFVPNTAVGDVLSVKIVKVLKNYAFGIIDSIITPSPDRICTDCSVSSRCGGCIFRHISYSAETKIKDSIVKNAFTRIGGLEPKFDDFIPCEYDIRYRNKAQFPLAVINGKAVCGFYAPRSHRVVPVNDCLLQPSVFSEITDHVLDYINTHNLSVYNEETHCGSLRHIYLRRGAHSGEIMLCLVAKDNCSDALVPLCTELSERFSDIKSIILNINPDKTNVILGSNCLTLAGSPTITDTMCGNKIEISPLSFYQVNTFQAERLYAKALEYAAPSLDDIVADLYCGAGTIGLSMARSAKNIIGIEIIHEAVQNAVVNAAANNISNAQFFCGDAGDVFSKLSSQGCSPNVIVVDPPRKGCSDSTLSVIAHASPDKIVMISCNPSTAARDAKWLSLNGFSVDSVCGVDMFPRTGHVECVVLMSRNEN